MYEHNVREAVGALRVGTAMSDGPLCILPLRSTAEVKARYVLLGQAISRGTLTITEVSEAGSVPYLQAVNKGPWPVLIFDGEELVGAKQNRITNATILVGVGKTILPVSCVEQGRWSHRSRAFDSGMYASHPSLRGSKERQVRDSAKAYAAAREAVAASGGAGEEAQHLRARRYGSNQGEVWQEVRRSSRSMGSDSPTMAMADAYESGKDDLDKIQKAFDPEQFATGADTVGALVFLGGRFVCLDLLRPAKRFTALYPKLLRGYALEALLRKEEEPKDFDAEASALRLFAEILEAAVEEQPAADLGIDLRLETKRVSGAGLVWQEELVQLSVFPRAAA
jgi:hypothetical protein